MDMNYEVRYLANGEEHTVHIKATSAAAASESVRHDVGSDGEDFELIQVHLLDEMPDMTETK